MKNNKFKRKIATALVATVIFFGLIGALGAPETFAGLSQGILPDEEFQTLQNKFQDISNTWYTEHVQWSQDSGYVKGYGDGTFRPDNQVTEAEFATMLVRYSFNIEDPGTSSEGHWSQSVYDILKQYKMPLNGYTKDNIKNTAITRGQVAKVVAAKNGFNLDEEQAIYYMYENELSNGVSEGLTLETYGKDLPLTRGATVTFLHRLKQAGVTTFVGEPSNAGDALLGIDGVPPSDVDVDFSDFQEEPEVIVDTGVEDAVTVLSETPRDEVVRQVSADVQEVYGITYDNNAIEHDMDLANEQLHLHKEFEALVEPTIKFDPDTRILTMDVPHLPDNLEWDGLIELATADGQKVQEYAIPQYHPAPYDKFIRTRIDINEFQGQTIELDLKQDDLKWDIMDKVRVYMNCQSIGGGDKDGSAYYEYWLE